MVSLAAMPVFSGAEKKSDISPAELSHRIAVIKRFKELLKAQRDRFRAYLDALDKQKDVIQHGTTDDLLRHVELEEKIVADIFSIQKVIDPLEKMYQSVRKEPPASLNTAGEEDHGNEVLSLREALTGLKAEAVIRSEQNRELLAKRMAELRSEIRNMKNNPFGKRKGLDYTPAPSHIDIKG